MCNDGRAGAERFFFFLGVVSVCVMVFVRQTRAARVVVVGSVVCASKKKRCRSGQGRLIQKSQQSQISTAVLFPSD